MTAAGTGVIFSTLSYTDWTTAMTSSTTTLGTGPATSLWKNETINIPAAALTSNQFRIRFLVTSDGSVADYGWLIDNVNINGVGSASGAWSPISELYTNAGATTPYTSGIATTIYTKPTSNHTYTYTATSSNGCTSSNTASVSVQVVAPPTGDTALYFCNSATAANLTAIGSTLKWYNAAVGGGAFSPSYVLINGQTYYASQTINGCESPTRFAVHVTISAVSVPTGSAAQTFNGSATPADIVATGTNLQWYLTPTGGTALAPTDQLVNATTYYGSQTINGCESSSRMAVAVTILYIKYVNIHFYLEGLYNSSTQMMNEAMDGNTGLPFYAPGIADRIQIDLFEEFSPYNPIGVSISGIDLATNGVASFQISPTHSGNYYIRVSNRNHLATWSAIAVPFNTAVVNYDFATSLFQAYGSSPQVQMSSSPDAFAFLLGDLDQGGWIDAVDFNMFEPDLTNGATGFYTTDFDGGGWVDAVDFNMFEPRLTLGNASEYPAKKK